MILFCNTLITETPVNSSWGYQKKPSRSNLKSFSNFDIFKYSLASLAVAYNWSKVILKISLDDIYKHRQEELEQFIKNEFNKFDLILEWQRNEYQKDWKNDYELLNDNLIWFYCNHDHIFFDSSQDYLNELVEELKDEELCSVQFSHWPECIRTIRQGLISQPTNGFISPSYKIHDNYLSCETANFDSIQIITKELYRRWWFEGEFNHIKLPRPDYFGIGLAEIKSVPIHKTVVPLKELCRHFDGYQHISIPITNNQCPAIEIPPGFFEKEMQIRYGYYDYIHGHVNINPLKPNYYAYAKVGTDYKFTLKDLPLVWKDRIKHINYGREDEVNEQQIKGRLQSISDMMNTSDYYTIDDEVRNKVFNKYLQPFNLQVDA